LGTLLPCMLTAGDLRQGVPCTCRRSHHVVGKARRTFRTRSARVSFGQKPFVQFTCTPARFASGVVFCLLDHVRPALSAGAAPRQVATQATSRRPHLCTIEKPCHLTRHRHPQVQQFNLSTCYCIACQAPHIHMHRQAVACTSAAHKSGTYRSLRSFQAAAPVPSAGIIIVQLELGSAWVRSASACVHACLRRVSLSLKGASHGTSLERHNDHSPLHQ
jgi:hypothetical protein